MVVPLGVSLVVATVKERDIEFPVTVEAFDVSNPDDVVSARDKTPTSSEADASMVIERPANMVAGVTSNRVMAGGALAWTIQEIGAVEALRPARSVSDAANEAGPGRASGGSTRLVAAPVTDVG